MPLDDFLPMPPSEGPPLPKKLGIRWPAEMAPLSKAVKFPVILKSEKEVLELANEIREARDIKYRARKARRIAAYIGKLRESPD